MTGDWGKQLVWQRVHHVTAPQDLHGCCRLSGTFQQILSRRSLELMSCGMWVRPGRGHLPS